ncbi:MAG TPA: prepilin-type N-terminal cleavage/methylation domain-containing protein [Rubrivivax sp.]|nr:prepilin-type N-terminal cleavage/methylation domain-containing protein [Rubrivivax sp.]
MMQLQSRPFQRGLSLIEALLALAVMGLGMMGLVGVQSTLRNTSDVAKQRSEAVRIAQVEIERWRAFTALAGGGGTNYVDMADAAAAIVGTNASFTRTTDVTAMAAPLPGSALSVTVAWKDRTDQDQSVQLSTAIAAIAPELAGTLSVPGDGDVVRQPLGRNRGIPRLAKELGGGNSGWIPPNSPGIAWVFNNTTGLISLCSTTAAATAGLVYDLVAPGSNNVVCTADKAVLVSGFLRYALGAAQPTAAQAAAPPSSPSDAPASNLMEVWVNHATVGFVSPMQCVTEHVNPGPGVPDAHTAYYCAVPVTVIPGVTPHWTGSLSLGPAASMAPALATVVTTKLKACRYHTAASYALQSAPLTNQNFLLMRAGDGAAAFTCPAPTTAHQPNA